MKPIIPHVLLLCLCTLFIGGCAAYPVVQVAGSAMTGYDAAILADEYLPRESVQGGEMQCNIDQMLERRLRERLRLNGMTTVSAHVVDRCAYLVGQVQSRNRAEYAIDTALTVQGLKSITVKFFPPAKLREAQEDTRILQCLSEEMGRSSRLQDVDLRVEVIRANAILIGKAGTEDQKAEAVAIAEQVSGVKHVVDYISVTPQVAPEDCEESTDEAVAQS